MPGILSTLPYFILIKTCMVGMAVLSDFKIIQENLPKPQQHISHCCLAVILSNRQKLLVSFYHYEQVIINTYTRTVVLVNV